MDIEYKRRLTLQTLFLGRLARLIIQETVVTTPEERRLVEWAIYSTCCDCYDLGLTTEVQHILAARRPRHEDTPG